MQSIALTLVTGLLLAGSLAATRAAAPEETAAASPTTHEVKMLQEGESYRFEPANLTIKPGDRVRFVTVSGAPHNVAFEGASIAEAAKPALAAGMPDQIAPLAGPLLLQAGDSYTVSFANVPRGRYPYVCMPHVAMQMKGTITVE